MTSDLTQKRCVPCEGGTKPMTPAGAKGYLAQVPGWELRGEDPAKLAREVTFKNFVEAMAFINKVAEVAESEQHHPDICVSWNRVNLELFTHSIGGLSENDFIVAAKVNQIEGARG